MTQIINDFSPYYTEFAHEGMDTIKGLSTSIETNDWMRDRPFLHERLPDNLSADILRLVPKAKELELMVARVSYFISKPGIYYRVHKDGLNKRFGVNYPLVIRDESCVTNWFDDSIAEGRVIDNLYGTSREVVGLSRDIKPVFSTVLQNRNVILFNTDIYHNWDNTKSSNYRVVLTLRSANPNIDYFKAKSILFDN